MATLWQIREKNGVNPWGSWNAGYWNDNILCSEIPQQCAVSGPWNYSNERYFEARLTPEGQAWFSNKDSVQITYKQGLAGNLVLRVSFDSSSIAGNVISWNVPVGDYYDQHSIIGSCCATDSDCAENEKCIEGECVDCDEQQATHFQIRFEYEQLVTTSDAKQVMSTLSSIYPISGSEGQIIQGQETSGVWYYPRIRFCDSDGEARPYTGALAFYGYCNPDGSSAMYSNNRGGLEAQSWVIGQKARTDSVSNNPWSVPRILIEFIEPSEIIYEPECSGVAGSEFPPIEPVEPTEPEEPDEPTEPEEPTEPTEPTKPTEPDAPQTGCECEIYIGEQIARAADIIYEGIILLKRQMSVGFREIVVEMYEARKLNYKLSMFLQNQQYQVLLLQHQRLYEILQAVQKGLTKDDDGLIDIVKNGLVEGDKGLVDYVKEFVDNYEAVTIENEYRTQSHRVIDNLDDVVDKL